MHLRVSVEVKPSILAHGQRFKKHGSHFPLLEGLDRCQGFLSRSFSPCEE
jgi:hypothetical protein